MTIRPAAPSDVPALAAFARWTYAQAFGASMADADLAHHLATKLGDDYFAQALNDDAFLLAEDKALIGLAQFGDARMDLAQPGDQELRRLYVHPERQGQGIGSALLEAMLAHPRLARAGRIYLDVWEDNVAAQKLYRRFGFEAVGRKSFAVASGAATGDDIVMARALR